jgi:hypothetical protein
LDKYKKITKEEIERVFGDILHSREKRSCKVNTGKLTKEEVGEIKRMFGSLMDTMGEDLYHIGNGIVTGKGGWEIFNKALREEAIKINLDKSK